MWRDFYTLYFKRNKHDSVVNIFNSHFVWMVDIYFLLPFFLIFTSCASYQSIQDKSFDSSLKESYKTKAKIYHLQPDTSVLLLKINSSDFLRKNEGNGFTLKFRIQISSNVLNSFVQLPDPFLVELPIDEFSTIDTLIRIPFFLPIGFKGYFTISMFDMHKGLKTDLAVSTNKLKIGNADWFLLCDSVGMPILTDYLHKNQTYQITSHHFKNQKIPVYYFNRKYPNSGPPFVMNDQELIDFNPDSTFILPEGEKIKINKRGIYFFESPLESKIGKAFVGVDTDYPNTTSLDQLIDALIYITERSEYLQLKNSIDKKALVDNFWLERAGDNKERAKILIRKYYGRVAYANENFTTYKEGWKTDKGMIYVIFGAPNKVYVTENTEVWEIDGIPQIGALRFQFTRATNIFSLNDYVLERDFLYRNAWYQAVEAWRQGIIRR